MKRKAKTKNRDSAPASEQPLRDRIMHAAMGAFIELGFAETSTLEIATRAKVSKRELYALFGTKQAMLVACIADRAQRMQPPPDLPPPRDRAMLGAMLKQFGAVQLRELSHPRVMAVFRLAIGESTRSPEVAQALDTAGRRSTRVAVGKMMRQAQAAGLLDAGDPDEMAGQFLALLIGDLIVSLLLRVRDVPDATEIQRRAERATAAFLQLHPAINKGPE